MNEKTNFDIDELHSILRKAYDKDTAYPNCQSEWNKYNPTYGQCAVTALVVQNYFGGKIYKCNTISHYFNIINGKVVDLTAEQFDFKLDYNDSVEKQPNLLKAQTKQRFELLKNRVENLKKDNKKYEIASKIKYCNKCGDLPKLQCDSIKKGNSKILVLGESPSKDGWIVSGKAFYNKEGKLQASGKVLNKLLNLCGLCIDEINFTEVCKCIITDRKTLRQCCQNCKPILFEQLDSFDCDVILPMGQFPTETIIGEKVEKLSCVVGKQFNVVFGKTSKIVVPIYHTSPINPKSYKGNEFIFKNILPKLLN